MRLSKHLPLWWNLAGAIVVAAFVTFFGVPDNPATRVVGSCYALLLVGLLVYSGSHRLISVVEGRTFVVANVLLFGTANLTFRYLLSEPKDEAYAFAMLIAFALSIQMVCTWALIRRRRGRDFVGHAAHAVCLKPDGEKLYTFVIFNKNHSLWLLPGGHMDIVNDEPYVVARHRILSELGYESTVVESNQFDKRDFADTQILNGCHAFYRIALGGDKCHSVHFDYSYVCLLTKRVVDARKAKYESIRFDVADCTNADQVSSKLREAVFEYYDHKQTSIPHEPFPSDLADRIYLGLDHYRDHMALRAEGQQKSRN